MGGPKRDFSFFRGDFLSRGGESFFSAPPQGEVYYYFSVSHTPASRLDVVGGFNGHLISSDPAPVTTAWT